MGAHRTVVSAQARRRWVVVLAVVAVLGSLPVLAGLRPVRAAEVGLATLRERIAASGRQAHEGYALSSGLLPLPALPDLEQVTALVTGTTELRTWYAAPDRWRVDVVDEAAERDLYQTPDAQYAWDYGQNQLTRIAGAQPVRLPRGADVTPPALGTRLLGLAAADRFTPLPGKRVAGLAAAGLRIVPASADTTVAHVDLWADPGTGLPLQVEVTARGGSRPVFVTRFLEVHLRTPDASVLTPPAPVAGMGFTVTDTSDILGAIDRLGVGGLPERLAGSPREATAVGAAGAYGAGLARFVVVALPGRLGYRTYGRLRAFGQAVTVPQGEAAILSTGLLTVLAVRADRTYLVAGLVQPALLRRVAAELAGGAA
ncbi:hypothetical protein ACPCHT_01315 [Nucisporomicrobium flavum]|uniref:hypothetical protein n=1 Tax=Nucisporomicrobium flavum TaxID=2785915 RepID=UPI0018F33197|nr:hypothetical protein [Nucisporomicrobium flavum]